MPRIRSTSLAVAVVLAWAALPAGLASAATITVSTTADEAALSNGRCALREAVEAANTDAAVGGCAAGDAVGADTMRLGPGPTGSRLRR